MQSIILLVFMPFVKSVQSVLLQPSVQKNGRSELIHNLILSDHTKTSKYTEFMLLIWNKHESCSPL